LEQVLVPHILVEELVLVPPLAKNLVQPLVVLWVMRMVLKWELVLDKVLENLKVPQSVHLLVE